MEGLSGGVQAPECGYNHEMEGLKRSVRSKIGKISSKKSKTPNLRRTPLFHEESGKITTILYKNSV
jgi:hypothetical protein